MRQVLIRELEGKSSKRYLGGAFRGLQLRDVYGMSYVVLCRTRYLVFWHRNIRLLSFLTRRNQAGPPLMGVFSHGIRGPEAWNVLLLAAIHVAEGCKSGRLVARSALPKDLLDLGRACGLSPPEPLALAAIPTHQVQDRQTPG